MTGKELIKWIQDNHAEDLPVAFDYGCYDTECWEIDAAEIRDDSDDIYSNVRKKHIHLV